MEVSIGAQTAEFLFSGALGSALGVLYDAMRVIRGRAHSRALTAAFDFLFWLVAAAAFFWFVMFAGDGEVRIYVIIGTVCGCVLYFNTLSRLVLKIGFMAVDSLLWVARHVIGFLRMLGQKGKNITKKAKKALFFRQDSVE